MINPRCLTEHRGFVCNKNRSVLNTAVSFLFNPVNEFVAFKHAKELRKSFIERMSFFTEMLINKFAEFDYILLTVDKRPDETARFIEVDITDFWLFKELLRKAANFIKRT